MKILLLDTFKTDDCSLRLAADSAWRPDRRPLFVPEGRDGLMLRLHLAVRISRLGKGIAAEFASRYYDAWTLAVLPDLGQDSLLIADDSVILGPWQPLDALPACAASEGHTVRLDIPAADLHNAISRLSRNMTFKTGDIIIIPPGLHSVLKSPGDSFAVHLDQSGAGTLLQFNIR